MSSRKGVENLSKNARYETCVLYENHVEISVKVKICLNKIQQEIIRMLLLLESAMLSDRTLRLVK